MLWPPHLPQGHQHDTLHSHWGLWGPAEQCAGSGLSLSATKIAQSEWINPWINLRDAQHRFCLQCQGKDAKGSTFSSLCSSPSSQSPGPAHPPLLLTFRSER